MLKTLKTWTIITAVLAILVYIDIFYFYGIFFITIPLTVLSAIITIAIAFISKKNIYILLNALIAVIAVLSFIIIPW